MYDKKAYQKQYHDNYDAAYYQRNKQRIELQKKSYHIQFRDWYNNLKMGLKCSQCGENDPRCLDFHHRDPTTKIGNCGDLVRMHCKRKLLAEIDKCEVLCSNCHRKLTRSF